MLRARPHLAKLPTCERTEGLFLLLQSSCAQAVADVVQGTHPGHLKLLAELGSVIHLALVSRRMQEIRNDGNFPHGFRKPPSPGCVWQGCPCVKAPRGQEALEVVVGAVEVNPGLCWRPRDVGDVRALR